MNQYQQTKSNFIIDNGFIFLGIGIVIIGITFGLTYELDNETQTAQEELKQTHYVKIILMIDFLITAGYWTMISGGILLSIFGYSLKRLLK